MLPKLEGENIRDICASFQEAVVDVLVQKTIGAAIAEKRRVLAISGGVSCNKRLRERFREACDQKGIRLLLADPKLCTDNAAMIAYVAMQKLMRGESSPVETDIDPNLKLA